MTEGTISSSIFIDDVEHYLLRGDPTVLFKIERELGGTSLIETPEPTKLLMMVSASLQGVNFYPTPFNQLYRIQAYIETITRRLSFAVYTKSPTGNYVNDDFRADPLSKAAARFLLYHNPHTPGLSFNWLNDPHSTNYQRYDKALQNYTRLYSQDEAMKRAARRTWTYEHLAEPFGFTDVTITPQRSSFGRIESMVGFFSLPSTSRRNRF